MEAFVAIVDSVVLWGQRGGYRSQRRSFHVTLLSLSSIWALVRLLHYTTRRLSLTPEGQVFVERSREVLSQWREASDELGHRHTQAWGPLSINVLVS